MQNNLSKPENPIIRFYLNDQLFKAKRIDINYNLTKIRQILGLHLPEKAFFSFSDGTEILKEDELNIKLNEILDDNNIYLIKKDNIYISTKINNKNNIFPEWLNPKENNQQNNMQNENCENLNEENNIIHTIFSKEDRKELKYLPAPVKYSNPSKISSNKINEQMTEKDKSNNVDKTNVGRKYPQISSCKKIETIGNIDVYLYPSYQFHSFEESKSLSFMVVGETGCGKTTLLNSFVNVLLGVNINDNFRYKIILENTNKSQAKSQTNQVRIYNIRSVGGYPPIKIIDTPGFGDTEGIEVDQKIIEQIKDFLRVNLNEINAICFVNKSTNNRLTLTQKYILSRIKDIFGHDMQENFIFMLTFCDGGIPNIIEQLQNKDCPFNDIIEIIKDKNWFFKFNNSSFFEHNQNDEYAKMFWNLSVKNFNDFISRLKFTPKSNLSLTKEVLKERQKLEDKICVFNTKLKQGLDKIEEIKELIKIIYDLQKEILDSKNYKQITKVTKIKKIEKNPNFYASTCIICNITCHSNCEIADDDQKMKCTSMDSSGYCLYCPKRCKWDQHKNRNYIFEPYIEENEVIFEELKQRYFNNKKKMSTKKEIYEKLKEELIQINLECVEIQENINDCINKLKNIALNKNNFESDEEFMELMIEVEKSEHKSGWENRIKNLEVLKQNKILLREIYQGTNIHLNQMKGFIFNELNKYINFDFE